MPRDFHVRGKDYRVTLIIILDYTKTYLATYILVFAVDVSQSAANPTISNPVES
jgi:hypothetical protein